MPGESDGHTETESEDGGVALSTYDSEDIDMDEESAPTSASGTPLQNLEEYGESSGLSTYEVLADASLAPTPTNQWQTMGGDYHLQPLPANSIILPTDPSYAEALLGGVGLITADLTFHDEDEALDPANPYHQPFGTHQDSPHPLEAALLIPPADEEQHAFTTSAEETFQSTQYHMPEDHDPTHAHTNAQHAESNIALPSLHDVFGSEFLSQYAPAAEVVTMIPVQDFHADYWDWLEDNMKNFRCDEFFSFWKQKYASRTADYPPISDLANNLSKVQRPGKVSIDDFDLEQGDYQGIHWSRFQTTKQEAREVRRMTYTNHRNVSPPEQPFGTREFKANFYNSAIPKSEVYFRFQEMNMRTRPYTAHFQLRHNLSASSKNALFYTQRPYDDNGGWNDVEVCSRPKIMCFNSEANTIECAMDLTKLDKDLPRLERVTTLTASDGVLVAGGLEGVYAVKSLSTDFDTAPTTGMITADHNNSTNHVETVLDRRSGLPQAIFDSNDSAIRGLDCLTNKFVLHHHFPYAVNCSATSPDGRLRLLVGDACYPLVANAETGELLARLPGHKDFGFSCAWAPDGITMATGHQDGLVQVWDARKLSGALQILPMEMGGCRAMAFSPAGSGKRILVLAEPADFVHIVDAQSFRSEQAIEFFGEISGISMPPDGSRLCIANCDPKYGGIMEFERCWSGVRHTQDYSRQFRSSDTDQRNLMHRIMKMEYGDSISDRSTCDLLDRRREEFKVGRSYTTDWLLDDELEWDQGQVGPRGWQYRQDERLKDLMV